MGYTPERDYQYPKINRFLRKMHPKVVENVIMQIKELGGYVVRDDKTDLLSINEEFSVSLVIARCWQTKAGSSRWLIRLDTGLGPDITIALRMDFVNRDPSNRNRILYPALIVQKYPYHRHSPDI